MLKERITCEQDLALFAARSSYKAQGKTAVHELPTHAPDYRLICNHYSASMGKVGANSSQVAPLKVYRVYNDSTTKEMMLAAKSGATSIAEMQCFFVSGAKTMLHDSIANGFFNDRDFVILWPSPLAAITNREEENSTTGENLLELLVVRTKIGGTEDLGEFDSISSAASSFANRNIPKDRTAMIHMNGDIGYLISKLHPLLINPEYLLLVVNHIKGIEASKFVRSIEDCLNDIVKYPQGASLECDDLLKQYTEKLNTEVSRYEERVWREMDPESARRLRDAEQDLRDLELSRDSLRQQIEGEKASQETILRESKDVLQPLKRLSLPKASSLTSSRSKY